MNGWRETLENAFKDLGDISGLTVFDAGSEGQAARFLAERIGNGRIVGVNIWLGAYKYVRDSVGNLMDKVVLIKDDMRRIDYIKDELGDNWIKRVKEMTGEGPLSLRLLARLSCIIERIRPLSGYTHIKSKLEALADHFWPTISELEYIDIMLELHSTSSIQLEHMFSTPSGKHPELLLSINSHYIYFEVSRLMDYSGCLSILRLYNALSTFQIGLKILKHIPLDIVVQFMNTPDEKSYIEVLNELDRKLSMGDISFQASNSNWTIKVNKGDGIRVIYPKVIYERKIKDKLEAETQQFDENEINVIVLDITPLIGDYQDFHDCINRYFNYSGNKVLTAVFLFDHKYVFNQLKLDFKKRLSTILNPLNPKYNTMNVVMPKLLYTKNQ